MTKRLAILAGMLLLPFFFTACGGKSKGIIAKETQPTATPGGGGLFSTPTPSPEPTSTPQPTATPTPPPGATPTPTPTPTATPTPTPTPAATATPTPTPTPLAVFQGRRKPIAEGARFTCVVTPSKTVRCTGINTYGQLGDNTQVTKKVLTQVQSLTNVAAIAAGYGHTCAVTEAGKAFCWGNNSYGQLGVGITPAQLALSKTPREVSGMETGVTGVAAGCNTSAFIREGEVFVTGFGAYGQIGDGTVAHKNAPTRVIGFAAGEKALAISIAADHDGCQNHVCAITDGGSQNAPNKLYCWGYNGSGQLGSSNTLNNTSARKVDFYNGQDVETAEALYNRTCVVVGGALTCFGSNAAGVLGDGSVVNSLTPRNVSSMSAHVTQIGGDEFSTCAIQGGALKCWGAGAYGALGYGGQDNFAAPILVNGFSTGTLFVGKEGLRSNCALINTGGPVPEFQCWGLNDYGQLGLNDLTTRLEPKVVPNYN